MQLDFHFTIELITVIGFAFWLGVLHTDVKWIKAELERRILKEG